MIVKLIKQGIAKRRAQEEEKRLQEERRRREDQEMNMKREALMNKIEELFNKRSELLAQLIENLSREYPGEDGGDNACYGDADIDYGETGS